jgi:hypothetical protein
VGLSGVVSFWTTGPTVIWRMPKLTPTPSGRAPVGSLLTKNPAFARKNARRVFTRHALLFVI